MLRATICALAAIMITYTEARELQSDSVIVDDHCATLFRLADEANAEANGLNG